MNTPYFVFDISAVKKNYLTLKSVLAADRVFYALKPNSEIPILSSLNEINASFEIASVEELEKLKALNIGPERIICSLPVKSEEMISALYNYGLRYFVFDIEEEFHKLKRLAPGAKPILRIDITDIATNTICYGMTYSEFSEAKRKGIETNGVTFYIAKNKNINIVLEVLDLAEQFMKPMKNDLILNIGGNYRLTDEVSDDYYVLLNERLISLKKKYNCTIYVEPGRSVIRSAGSLVTSVIGVKQGKNYVYIDAGEPTGISYYPDNIINLTAERVSQTKEYSFWTRPVHISCCSEKPCHMKSE